jgi:hypothetical protein
MASTVMSPKPHGEERVRDAGELQRKSAKELAGYMLSGNPIEASIGMAAFNSLNDFPKEKLTKVNAFKVVGEKGVGKHVAIFGHFPYLKDIKASASRTSVFELYPSGDELSLDDVPAVLPDARVVAITSTSIINHTLDAILPHLHKDAFTVLVGPSTPLSPILFDLGFNLLAGVYIVDEDALFQTIGQAAIFRQVRGADLITIAK